MPALNPYRGEVDFTINGEVHKLCYPWSGIAALQADIGQDFDAQIGEALAKVDLAIISKALAIGLQGSWPGVTPGVVMELSPPLNSATQAIGRALRLSFHGPGEVATPSRKGPLMARLARIWSWLGIGARSEPA